MLEEISGKLDWKTGLFELEIYAVVNDKPYALCKSIPVEDIESTFLLEELNVENKIGFSANQETVVELGGFQIGWNIGEEEIENDTENETVCGE